MLQRRSAIGGRRYDLELGAKDRNKFLEKSSIILSHYDAQFHRILVDDPMLVLSSLAGLRCGRN